MTKNGQQEQQEKKTPPCDKCGSDSIMLTEEKNAIPKCGGCGKQKTK